MNVITNGTQTHRVDSVGRQEKDPLVVLQQSQEDRDESISVNIRQRPLLQEDVGFVNEKDGIPRMSEIQDPRQLLF
jgi:hypothetical protein